MIQALLAIVLFVIGTVVLIWAANKRIEEWRKALKAGDYARYGNALGGWTHALVDEIEAGKAHVKTGYKWSTMRSSQWMDITNLLPPNEDCKFIGEW